MLKDKIQQILNEKFGYTTDLKPITRMHDGPTEGKKPQPSSHPMEQYRNIIKSILGATTTEEDGIVEDVIDFSALHRLANKHGFSPALLNSLNTIELEIQKPVGKRDRDIINKSWEEFKGSVPFWFLGLLSPKDGKMEDLDKKNITNLITLMDKFNKNSKTEGETLAKETENASRDTNAKKNLDKARKDAGIDLDAASEKKLSKKPKNEIEPVKPEGKEPVVPEPEQKDKEIKEVPKGSPTEIK